VFAEERKINIAEYIKQQKKATVNDLCDLFQVSSATIRNDLRDLEYSGVIIRTHGGAILKTKTGFELTANQKMVHPSEEKRIIGKLAVELVEDGDTIVLDTGTTTAELAKHLFQKQHITVVTNDFIIANILEESDSVNTIFMGGQLRKGFNCTIGLSGQQFLSELAVDKAFMGANSFSFQYGATTPDIHQAATKKAMIRIASEVLLLCEHAKFGRNSFALFARPEQIDICVTDRVDEEELLQFKEWGITVITPELRDLKESL